MTISHFTFNQTHAARAAITFAALILDDQLIPLEDFQQVVVLVLADERFAEIVQCNGRLTQCLELEVTQVVSIHLRIDLTHQIRAHFNFLRRNLYVVRHQPRVDPWDRV